MSDQKYVGKDVDITWQQSRCIHIGECGRAENELFVGGRKPWCDPNLVQLSDSVDVVLRCPTGALAYERKDGGAAEVAPEENRVTVVPDGPLYVSGDIELSGADDGVPFRVALCRCGQSKNKPYCDGTHAGAGFKDSGAVGRDGDGLDAPGGKLEIQRAQNGPLLLSGNFSIRASSGRVAFKGTKAALCRCGESKNKPFCDGTHTSAGFKAD